MALVVDKGAGTILNKMLLDMATKNMDPVSRTIMRSSIGADLFDLDMAGGGGGNPGSLGQGIINFQQQQQFQQRQQQLLLQQRQQNMLQLQLLKRQQQLKLQRDAANMILAATAVGKAADNQKATAATNQVISGSNPYSTAKADKETIHISLYITNPTSTLRQAARSRMRPVGNPATNMMSNMAMMQAMRGLELV